MRKLFLFLFFLVFSFSLFVTPVFANQQMQNVTLAKDQTINNDYFTKGGTVTVLGTVNGDSYTAGGTVTIEGNVKGDVIAGGGTVTINGSAQNVRVSGGTVTINGNVAKNITVLGGTVTIEPNAKVAGSIVAAGGTINILSPIGKGATIVGGNVTINNVINGDVYATIGQLTLGSEAKINGNLYYTSEQKVQIAQGATVSGEVEQTMPQKPSEETKQKAFLGLGTAAFFFKLMDIISLFIVGMLLILLAPNYVKRVAHGILEKTWQSLGIGILTLILAPIIFIILLITIVGVPLAFIFLALYLIALYISKIFTIYLLGERIGVSLNPKMHMLLAFLIGLIIYEVLTLIPFIGWLFDLAVVIFGLGSLLIQKKHFYTLFRKEKAL